MLHGRTLIRTAGVPLLAALWLVAAAPAVGQAPVIEAAPKLDDTVIEQRLRSIFSEIDGLKGVEIQVEAGVVHLTGSVLSPDQRKRALELANRVEAVVAVEEDIRVEAATAERLDPALSRARDKLGDFAAFLPVLALAFGLLGLFWLMGWGLARLRVFDRIAPNAFVRGLMRQVIVLLFLLAGALLAVDVMGATALFGSLLGAAGIAGLVVGFGLRDTVENYIASILLSIRQPFAPQDHIKVEGYEGVVSRLTSRATILVTLDGNHVRIPNSIIFKSIIVNYTRSPERQFRFELPVPATRDLVCAQAEVRQVLCDLPEVLDQPEPLVLIDRISDYTAVLVALAWVDQRKANFGGTRSKAIGLAQQRLHDAGLSLGEQVFNLRQMPAKELEPVPQAEPVAETAAVMDTRPDWTITDKAAADRHAADEPDLLHVDAPKE